MIAAEKMIEESMQIGKGARSTQKEKGAANPDAAPGRMIKDTSASGNVENKQKAS